MSQKQSGGRGGVHHEGTKISFPAAGGKVAKAKSPTTLVRFALTSLNLKSELRASATASFYLSSEATAVGLTLSSLNRFTLFCSCCISQQLQHYLDARDRPPPQPNA